MFERMWWWLPLGRVPEIEARTLAEQLESDRPPLLLDVRSPHEFSHSHIPGALNVPITRLRGALDDLELPGPVVAICLTAHRSIVAVRLLRRRGVAAQQLAGGMLAWWRARLPSQRSADGL